MIVTIITIIIVFFIYNLWVMINFDKAGNSKRKKSQEKKMPAEVKFFVYKYNIDLDKVNYRYFLRLIGLVVAIDVSVIATILDFINIVWLKIVMLFVLVIVSIFVSFGLLGNYFKKKGLTKDENNKRNRK